MSSFSTLLFIVIVLHTVLCLTRYHVEKCVNIAVVNDRSYTVGMGFATPAEENALNEITLDNYMIEHPDQSFMLRVSGDSMRDAGILSGDLVIVERATEARSGNIVITEVDGAREMKYFQDLIPQQGLRITAVVKGVVRKYD